MPPSIQSVTEGKSPAADLAAALLRGNPDAHRFVDEQLNKKEPIAFADQFVADTYGFPKVFDLTAKETKAVEPYLAGYRTDVRRAHRFILDDDFTRLVTEVSSQITAQKLLARLQYAVLPYETTWIEFNLKTKVRVMRAIHNMPTDGSDGFDMSDVAERMGILLHRIDDTSGLVEMVCENDGVQSLIGTLVSYFFSTSERDFPFDYSYRGSRPMVAHDYPWTPEVGRRMGIDREHFERLQKDQNLMQLCQSTLWGYSQAGKSGVLSKIGDLQNLTMPSYLLRHGTAGYSRCYQLCLRMMAFASKDGSDTLARLLARETAEFTGMMRWIVVLLAMLSEVPTTAQLVEPEGYIRTGLTSRRPLMGHHRLTLRIPKEHPHRYIERRFHEAARRRAHEVRAHWRTYLPDSPCRRDDHVWIYDHDEGYRLCEKCEAYGRLIKEHVRGDPKLGWVDKTYHVKKARQT